MKARIAILFCLSMLLHFGASFDGFDIDSALPLPSSDRFKCLVTAYNATRAGVFISNTVGSLNPNAQAALTMTTTTLGLRTQALIEICATKDAATQINSILGGVSPQLYDGAWISVTSLTNTGCQWTSKTPAERCQYIKQMIQTVQGRGKQAGIISIASQWKKVLGDVNACPEAANGVLLWYYNDDRKKDFSSFVPFGGWKAPTAKAYEINTHQCSVNVDGFIISR